MAIQDIMYNDELASNNIIAGDVKQRSLLFAKLAADAYGKKSAVKKVVKEMGFTKCKFYDIGGAQAYRFESDTDVVVACRGTQPTEFNDLKADLKAFPVKAETISRVHRGFKLRWMSFGLKCLRI